eukprot:gene7927-8782_t
MERRIISDAQITASSTYNQNTHTGKEARLHNGRCWCSASGTQILDQWVKIDLEKRLRVTGIAIQGDPAYTPNYIKKFKLKYSIDGTIYFVAKGNRQHDKIYDGANGDSQLITKSFEICNKGLGIESGLSLPSGFVLTASSFATGNEAVEGRLSGALSWCANTNNNANEYIQINFAKTITMTGIAVQGNPTALSWVKDFYVEYGITEASLATYTEKGVNKLFVGNVDKNTIVVNWFQVRLKARYVRVKPNTFDGNKCMRFEIIGCDTDFIAEAGAENRVLDDSKFFASGYFQTDWSNGRYMPKDGRLHNDRPWGDSSSGSFWFKVDLGRTMLVNGIATQGDATYALNYFSDYKLQFSQSNANFLSVKSEGSSSVKIFPGNTNSMGVKFNLLKFSPISTRYVQFLKHTETLNDDTLRVEIYALPQVCSSSFGMEAGEPSTYEPTITVSTGMSTGIVPSSKAKINSNAVWCAGNTANTHHFTFDFGKVKQISGVAIQGHPSEDKWVKKFKIQYGSSLSSLTTYSDGGSEKEFIGCNSRNLIVYNWFSTEITARYLRILPTDSNTEVCVRLNVYGCPSTECFKRIGIGSSSTIANSLLTASTYSTGNEAFKSRFNSLTTWVACQVGSCTPKETTSSKPWIQVCLGSARTFSAVVIQGHGDHDNIADVKTFSVQYIYTQAGTIYDYILDGTNKIFSASPGRYGSKQADFPIAIAAKCLRIKVESQTDISKNVGLRWELLGCNSVTKMSVTLTTSSLSIARGSKSTVTCSATGQEGGVMSYKVSDTTITNSDIYSLGDQTRTNANTNGVIQRNIEITANGPSVGSSFTSCSITDSAQAKPRAPTGFGASSITSTGAKVTWTASVARDVPVESYKVSIKKKSDGLSAGTDQTVTLTEVTFTNLTPFTEYTVEVTAKSRNLNVFSPIGTHRFKTDEGAATTPTSVAVTPLSATEINVTWEIPSPMNGILHNYQIRYKKSSDQSFSPFVNAGKLLSKTINKLEAYTDYEFQVAATTKGGTITGTFSSSAAGKTLEGLPLEPRSVQVVSTESRAIVLKWEKPSKENGIIRSYRISVVGVKSYNLTFRHEKSVILNVSQSQALSMNVTGLVPGSDYSVHVTAATSIGFGAITPPLAEVTKKTLSNGTTNLVLKRAWNINGPITRYVLTIGSGLNRGCTSQLSSMNLVPSRVPLSLQFVPGSETVFENFNFQTIANYTICFRAVIINMTEIFNGPSGVTTVERKTLKTVETSTIGTGQITVSQITIPLQQGPSNTKFYQIVVTESTNLQPLPSTYKKENLGPYDASKYQPGTPYIAAEFSSSAFSSAFTVGDGKDYSRSQRRRRNTAGNTYSNVALKPGTSYSVFQRAFVSEDVYYSSNWIGPLKTKPKTNGGNGGNGGGTAASKSNIGAIVGVIVAIVVVIALVLLVAGVVIKRRRGMSNEKQTKAAVELKDLDSAIRMEPHPVEAKGNGSYEEDEDELANERERLSSIVRRKSSAVSIRHRKPPTEVRVDRHHHPVSVQNFPMHAKQLQKDSHHALSVEYKKLKKDDHSRVPLEPLLGQPDSDYFNANFISSYTRPSVYVAAQGPVDGSEFAFWRMIWDNNIPALIMLTNVMERAKKKCAQYWPDGGEIRFGDITIELASMDNYVDYVIRSFNVTRKGHQQPRRVHHFHFLSWPDHGVPEFPTDLLNFRGKLRKFFPSNTTQPILVHCSAGVGRTGTFIVVDSMLHLARREQKVDIFNYLNFIRSQRIQLVQTEEQYIFIYHALLEAITCGITEIDSQNFRIETNQLDTKNEHGKTGFQIQFERLTALTHKFLPGETVAALKPVNETRNRHKDILPRDMQRIVLQQSIYENDCSDYINATYVAGYKRKDAFIATEHPLPETISDFWTMVWQREVAAIVILNKSKEGQETYPVYWPALDNETRHGNVYISNQYEKNEKSFMRRIVHIRHRDQPDDVKELDMYQFHHWPAHAIPKETSQLLSLLASVDKSVQQHGSDHPIIVTCSDGASRTGTFIAISNLLERIKTEQLIDVFQTIKKIRFFRPQFVENNLQYQFCFKMAQAYMDSFDTYANFA